MMDAFNNKLQLNILIKGGDTMLYFVEAVVKYSAQMSQQDLFAIWAEEADAALGAKEAGVVVDLWKCVGERRVLLINSDWR
jgi:muconolactone D-isomerase